MSRLPVPGSDDGVWGSILNDFLKIAHNTDGSIKPIDQSQVTGLQAALAAKLSQADVSGKADDSKVVHNDRSETINGDFTFPVQAARTGQITLNSVNDPGGFVQKNIVFKDAGPLSRGGPVWVDSNGRVQAWLGWHDIIPSGSPHHGVEVKTAGDPSGPNTNVLVTRFRLKSDSDQTQAAFYSCSMVYIENGIYSPDTQFGITFNTPQSGSVASGTSSGIYSLGKLTVSADSAGVATMDIGVGLDNTTGAKIRMFRDSNVPTANLAIFAADGTATQTFFIDAKTGAVTMAGRLQFKTASGTVLLTMTPTLDGSNNTLIDNDVATIDTTHSAHIRFFRNTTTTGTRKVRLSKGDGTNTDTVVLDAGAGALYGLGQDGVTLQKTVLNDDPRITGTSATQRSSDVATMDRVSAASNLNLTTGNIYTIRATAKSAGTYTKIRFATASTAPSGLTDVRAGVFDPTTGTPTNQTANIAASITAANSVIEQPLDAPITVTGAQDVFLGVGFVGTTLQVKGSAVAASMAGLAPVMSKSGSWAGGVALGAANGAATGNLLWIELVP